MTARHARPRRPPRALVALLVLAQVALLAAALAAPLSFAWVREKARQLGPQTVVASSNDTVDVGALASPLGLSRDPTLLVLTYHNIEEHPHSPYSLTPRRFADQMHVLSSAGYTAASGADIRAALAGRPLRGHKVLITFDDGTKGMWTYADPILARYRLRALAFLVTGNVGLHQPYYADWDELRAMQRSGRWEFGSHSHLAHGLVPTSEQGGRGPAMASLAWLPALGRQETVREYARRIRDDLTASKAELRAHGLRSARFFAFPFSQAGDRSNDPRVFALLAGIVSAQFDAAFTNAVDATSLTAQDLAAHLLPRIEVTRSTSTGSLLATLRRASPRNVRQADPAHPTDWCCAAGNPNVSVSGGAFRLLGTKQTGWRVSTYGPSAAASWGSYQATATGRGLVPGAAAALILRSSGQAGVRVVLSRASVRVSVTDGAGVARELLRRRLAPAESHSADVQVGPARTQVTVDNTVSFVIPASAGPAAGGFGLGTFRTLSTKDLWFDHVKLLPAT